MEGHKKVLRPGLPRILEIALAGAGLMVLSPLMFLVALAVGLSSPGPILFRQERLGLGGESFTLMKFRTMSVQSEGPEVTARGDSRVTCMGKFLRKIKLDELPELWNVLRGDMSFVGPRPEVPGFVDLNAPRWQEVLHVRPGITDPVTLRLRNEEELLAAAAGEPERFYLEVLQPYKLRGYVKYLERRSARSDFHVIIATLLALVTQPRAEPPSLAEIQEQRSKEC